jgi:hypothetical protein
MKGNFKIKLFPIMGLLSIFFLSVFSGIAFSFERPMEKARLAGLELKPPL